MIRPADPRLARYLHPSPDQRRLLDGMAAGHAWKKHGRELGDSNPASFRARVRAHLNTAPSGISVRDQQDRPRYLIADQRTNQVAWITPHKEHRSTLFSPRDGVDVYVRAQRAAASPKRSRVIDLVATRAAARAPARGIASAARGPDRGRGGRVP